VGRPTIDAVTGEGVMKLKEFFYLLGLKPRARTYGVELQVHTLPRDGRIEVAQWLAPKAHSIVPKQEEIDRLRTILRPGDVAIDVGAHMGDTALPMAFAVGAAGAVFALEPNPYVYPVLEQNAGLNRDRTRIIPLRFAAMREDGEYEFQYGGPEYSNGGFHEGMSRWRHASAFTVKVPGHNVDRYLRANHPDLLPKLRLIKVDAEGFDLAVLETMVPLIVEFHPWLQVEMFSLKRSLEGYRERLFDFLTSHGYQVRRIEKGPYTEGTLVTRENLNQWNYFDAICIPG
jgi:FkbM family methyltransferase